MKQILAAVSLIVIIISLLVVAFTVRQVDNEDQNLKIDLQHRTTLLAESLKETVEPNFINKSDKYLQQVVERFANKERFAGLAIYDNQDNLVAVTSTLPKEISQSQLVAAHAMDEDKASGDFVKFMDQKMYVFAIPLHDKDSVVGALMVVQNASYIDSRLTEIWRNNLIRLFIQASLLSVATLLILRWIIYVPIISLVETLKAARSGNLSTSAKSYNVPNFLFFSPLVREVTNIRRSLIEARVSASEEARMRLEKLDSPWTAERLKEFVKDTLKGRTIFVVSNREPYIHTKHGGRISYYFPASGMATAIEPIMEACGGMWIAHGSGDADRLVVDLKNKIMVPPDEPKYTLRRVWLTPKEEEGYYYGFANEGIWPLCHIAYTRPIFRKEDWEQYQKVNGKFAKTVLEEIKDFHRPIILVQDYHFALLPRMIKSSRPDATIGFFWHIPWPNAESFSICPWRKELADGVLGSDIIGFHTQLHCNNFIETVGRELESLIDWEQFAITRDRHVTYVKPFPISIAFSNGGEFQNNQGKFDSRQMMRDLDIQVKYVGLGVDRLDYTKGILERLKAIEIFLERYTPYRGQFIFIQLAAPSRSRIKRYQEFAEEVQQEVDRINNKFKTNRWKPILYIPKHHSHEEINKYYKLADLCLVTSLHDGMNLVAKEYIAARDDEKGVLILSQFAGASRELKEALIVNPYDAEQVANSMHVGLQMMKVEQTRRMRKMRESIKSHNIYRWSAELLKTIVNLG
ncbi:trehalose-6-phosphate synthase [Patescibacteria group bacterium]|nr:trehalose-6-phosphate synthase [Patescibacteria group bacterium]MCL5797985.1 trehalose-6-phosphate synthase [Patescibacteria group bacterium]